jgi:hypothetical protein
MGGRDNFGVHQTSMLPRVLYHTPTKRTLKLQVRRFYPYESGNSCCHWTKFRACITPWATNHRPLTAEREQLRIRRCRLCQTFFRVPVQYAHIRCTGAMSVCLRTTMRLNQYPRCHPRWDRGLCRYRHLLLSTWKWKWRKKARHHRFPLQRQCLMEMGTKQA